MPLPVTANPLLDNPSLRLLLEVEAGSLPITLPHFWGTGPLMVSTEDRYVPALTRVRHRTYAAQVLADNPVGYWRLGDLSGTEVAARVGVPGTYVNTPTLQVAGALAGDPHYAVTFSAASSEYASVPADAAWSIAAADALTLECWVKVAAAPASNRFILAKRQGGAVGSPYYQLAIDTSGRVDWYVRGASGGEGGIDGGVSIANGAWRHVVAVRDPAQDALLLYVDGRLRRIGTDPSIGDLATLNPFWIGVHGTTTPISQYLNGSMQELAIYRTALSAQRIEAHWQAGKFNSQTLFAGRMVEAPQLKLSAADVFGGMARVDQLGVRLKTRDPDSEIPDLSVWMTKEVRGWRARGHLYNVTTDALVENAFVGQLTAIQQDGMTSSLLFAGADVSRMYDVLPALKVTTQDFPDAPALASGQGLGLGADVPLGVGIGRNIELPAVKGRGAEEETLQTFTFTADAGANELTVSPALDLELVGTGDAPFTLASTGTLPAPLLPGVPYWLIVISATVVALALTPGDALADTPAAIDITSTGSGVHTLSTGRAAQRDNHYDFAISGNVGVVEVTEGDVPVLRAQAVVSPAEGEDPGFSILHREYHPDAAGVTVIRFQDDVIGSTVRATVQRVYPDVDANVVAEWKWLHGGQDDVGGLHAVAGYSLGASTAGTDDLTRGPNPLGFGAVLCDGVWDYWQTPFSPAFLAQTFTIEGWVYLPSSPSALHGLIASGPGPDDGSFDVPAWSVTHNPVSERLNIFFRFGTLLQNGFFSPNGSIPRDRWTHYAVVVTPDHVWIYINGVLVEDDIKNPIVYPTQARGLVFGRLYTGAVITPYALNGRVGYTRYSSTARTAREVASSYYRMRRNPIEALRTLETAAGTALDDASWDTAAAVLDDVQGGALRADGWLTAARSVEQIRQEFVPFRDLRFGRTSTGRLSVTAAAPATGVAMTLEVGGGYNNIAQITSRVRASLAECVRALPVVFRLGNGSSLTLVRDVHCVGRVAEPLVLPWVDDIVAADIIGCFRAKRLRTRDELLELIANYEAREAAPGVLVRLTSAGQSISARDYETVRADRLPSQTGLSLTPHSNDDFPYVPSERLPPETLPIVLRALDLGQNPGVAVAKDGNVLTLTLVDLQQETLRPIADGPVQQFGTIVGASSAWAAVDEVSADEESTYAETLGTARLFVRMAVPVRPLARVRSISLTVRARKTDSAAATIQPLVRNAAGVEMAGGSLTLLTTSYADYTVTWTASPFTGQPWSIADLNALVVGAQVVGAQAMRITRVAASYDATGQDPDLLGGVDWWRVGPSASQPATPASTDPRTTHGSGLVVTYQEVLSAGTHWYWARALDRRGRPVLLVGPGSVVV